LGLAFLKAPLQARRGYSSREILGPTHRANVGEIIAYLAQKEVFGL